jgi:glycosyltransferase involved in cell wall biosynthesis
LHQRLGIDGRILLYVGRLATNKRVPLLIEALARLNDPSAHFVIIGDCNDIYAEEAGRCRTLAEQLGVAKRVHFLDQLDEDALARAYRSAEVFVMPSLHEGFCVPVIEAMASGLPVIASRSAALPEVVGSAGLTFAPGDVEDLVRQLRRVLVKEPPDRNGRPTKRIAVVSFRSGPDIGGGAETSLRTMAKSLQAAGCHVEVFTTCTRSESRWHNELPAGTVMLDGLTVHRFPIDAHDVVAHGETVRAIFEAEGQVSPDLESHYLQHSIHSTALLAALEERTDFDAIVTGPYLLGLTADIGARFSARTLLVPCFHDEPLARLAVWPRLYSQVGGILYHSAEEQELAQVRFGVNHPNTAQIGTLLRTASASSPSSMRRPYVVYCGRLSAQKNVPLLVEWARRYQSEHPGCFDFVFMGQGEVELPDEPWLVNLGRVDEAKKCAVLAGAKALVQLSTQESLSIVVLEAWAERTPVIVHGDCAVLAGQIERSDGGATVKDYETFAAALDDLHRNEVAWHERGDKGLVYVQAHYVDEKEYVARLIDAIGRMRIPIAEQMRERGLQRAAEFGRERWQRRFGQFVEHLLTQPARAQRQDLNMEPLRSECRAAVGTRTLLLPLRLVNQGTQAAIPDGPGRTRLCCEIRNETAIISQSQAPLPALLMPGQTQVAAMPVTLPAECGFYRLVFWMECMNKMSRKVEVPLLVEPDRRENAASCASTFLDTVQETLPKTHAIEQLPVDYVDVTEGRFAPVKRMIKRKLLNNFKQSYVDVLSRQQSQVNGQVVLMIQQLAECCAMLDHAVAGLHERMDGLEARLERLQAEPDALARA